MLPNEISFAELEQALEDGIITGLEFIEMAEFWATTFDLFILKIGESNA